MSDTERILLVSALSVIAGPLIGVSAAIAAGLPTTRLKSGTVGDGKPPATFAATCAIA